MDDTDSYKKSQKPKSRSTNKLRDKAAISKAMDGKTTIEIADEMGLSRATVSRILNSDDVKKKIKEIDAKLASGIDDAINTVLDAVKVDYVAARDLLKNYGSMKAIVDVNHQFPKPTVIQLKDGTKLILGAGGIEENEV